MSWLTRWGALAAGAVLVVAVTVALPLVLSGLGGSDPGPADPADAGRPLALDALQRGAPPARGHLAGDEFRSGSGTSPVALATGGNVRDIASVTGGFLVMTSDEGNQEIRFLGEDGAESRTWRIGIDAPDTSLVVSTDGRLGAFVRADGRAVVVEDGGRAVTELATPEGAFDIGFVAVAVSGTSCVGADADCAVLVQGMEYTSSGDIRGTTWTVRPGRPAVVDRRGIGEVHAVSGDGLAAGRTKIIEDGDGGCSGVADQRGTLLWSTCKDRLIAFSPDAKLVLAGTSTSFGSGDHELTVLDARTGKQRLRLRTAEDVGIFEMRWEDEDHVLAVVGAWDVAGLSEEHVDHRWAVVRIGIDGSREYAVEPVRSDADGYDGPLDLPVG